MHHQYRIRVAIVLTVATFLSPNAHAKDPPAPPARLGELEKKLDDSLKIIGDLAARVKQLEMELASQRQTSAKTPEPKLPITENAGVALAVDKRLMEVETRVAQMGNAPSRDATSLPLRGFADVNAFARNGKRERGFGAGTLDFYLTPELGGGFKSLVELVVERGEDGGTAIDLERVQVGYSFNDAATLWMGRMHTPFGYWNTAFHHGQQLQTSIQRPRFIDFEDKGGIVPAHLVGLWLTGHIPVGSGKVTYDLVAANAPRILDGVLNPNNFRATGRAAAFVGNLGYRFGGGAEGLRVGAHALAYRTEDNGVNPLLGRAGNTRVRGTGLYLVYDSDNWDVIGESYFFRNRSLTEGGPSRSSNLAFLQVSYLTGYLTPYARWERTRLDQRDDYFAGQTTGQSYQRGVLGIRFDTTPNSAIKVEANRTRFTDRDTDTYGEIRTELSVRF